MTDVLSVLGTEPWEGPTVAGDNGHNMCDGARCENQEVRASLSHSVGFRAGARGT